MKLHLARRQFILGGVIAFGSSACDNASSPESLIANKSAEAILIEAIIHTDHASRRRLLASIKKHPALWKKLGLVYTAVNHYALKQHVSEFSKLDLNQREALLTRFVSRLANNPMARELLEIRTQLLMKFYSSVAGQTQLGYKLPVHYSAYEQR